MSFLTAGALMGQKTKTDKAKFDYTRYPAVPAEGLDNLGLQVFTGDLPFNKDTLRLYLGNMDMMKSNAERLSKVKYQALKDVTITGGEGDITVDMAIGAPMVVSKEQKTSGCMIPKDGCTQYYYMVNYRIPAVAQVRKGDEVITTWALEPDMVLQFGNEQIETHESIDEGSRTSIRVVNYTSEADLKSAFAKTGDAALARKGIVIQLGKLAEGIYERAFFEETGLSFDIAYGSGKASDYTDTESAAATAVSALQTGDYTLLEGPVKTWEARIEHYNPSDKKAAVNKKVAQGLFENLSIAYTFTDDFDRARENLDKALELAKDGFVNQNEVDRLNAFHDFINHRELSVKYNASLKPTAFVNAPDIKQTFGRRKFNKDLDFLIAEDRYAEIAKVHGAGKPEMKKDISEMTVEEFLAQASNSEGAADDGGEISLDGRVENKMLVLSGLVDANMRGKALPPSLCTYTDIKTIRAVNIGLTGLPDCLGELTALKTLVLSKNDFETIPDAFGNMSDLKTLDISDNRLTELPESIFGLKNLKKLSVSGNEIPAAQLERLERELPDCKIK